MTVSYQFPRLHNLRSLGLSAEELAQRAGGRPVYWKRLLHGIEPFGNPIARRLEIALKIPDGSMDSAMGIAHEIRRAKDQETLRRAAKRTARSGRRRMPLFA